MVRQATAVQLADVHPAGATLVVVVAVRLAGEAAAVVAHPVGEVVPLLEAGRLVGVEMADALRMAEETDHGLLMEAAMAPELHMAAQLHTEAPHHMAERQHTAAMMETVPRTVASTLAAAHLVGVDHPETPLQSLAVSLLLRLVLTTPQHLALTLLLPQVAMVLTLRLRLVARPWMLLLQATTLRLLLVTRRVVDMVLRRPHLAVGMLRRRHLVAILATIRNVDGSRQCKIGSCSMGLRETAQRVGSAHGRAQWDLLDLFVALLELAKQDSLKSDYNFNIFFLARVDAVFLTSRAMERASNNLDQNVYILFKEETEQVHYSLDQY